MALILLSAISLNGCGAVVSAQTTLTSAPPTVFRNAAGETIEISVEGMRVGGHFYRAYDCSNTLFNCRTYAKKVLLITPKICFPPPAKSWRAGGFSVSWRGYEYSSDMLQATYGNGIGYVFSEVAGQGIRAFAYDVSGKYHVAPEQSFYGNIPNDKLTKMAYYAPTGPALFPCTAAPPHG